MPQLSTMRPPHALSAECRMTAGVNLGQSILRQVHQLCASLEIGPRRPGRTAQESQFVNWLIEIISASAHQRIVSKEEIILRGMRQFALSQRRAKALREQVIEYLDAKDWSSAGAPKGERRRTR
jgi:hypothetical protein